MINSIPMSILILYVHVADVFTLPLLASNMSLAYFQKRDLREISFLSCSSSYETKTTVNNFITHGIRTSVLMMDKQYPPLDGALKQLNAPVGIFLDASCTQVKNYLTQASMMNLFDALHFWLIIDHPDEKNTKKNLQVEHVLSQLNLSINTDVVVARFRDSQYKLIDVFNYGKIQGNGLESTLLGTWSEMRGMELMLNSIKFYNRWNFHNLTLRAVSVILERPKIFNPEMLTGLGYTAGVSAMTKITAQLLYVLMKQHNFRCRDIEPVVFNQQMAMLFVNSLFDFVAYWSILWKNTCFKFRGKERAAYSLFKLATSIFFIWFNYTIVGRWIGSPARNSTLAVTNSLYWGEQDISCTCARIFPKWLNWVDIFFPAATTLETKFFYLIPDKGVGNYENRFLTPMSSGVWWCSCIAGFACVIILATAARIENRPEPHVYAFFSVFATTCQQEYEDGLQILQQTLSSQGRRLILLVVGLTSMLLYNYYTSSVVSWLLNAAAPTLHNLDALMDSDLELVFEDIGYTRGWLDNPGFFYYSGYKNPKEDELRNRKVINGQRTVPLLQPVNTGIELVRSGGYAYHTEPYTAYQAISKTFDETELCKLGYLQMMQPAQVYIMGQKHSPYKHFFVWSLMRLQERGHVKAAQGRIGGYSFACSGRTPRALALGQAAPAFALLTEAMLLSVLILILEILWKRSAKKQRRKIIS